MNIDTNILTDFNQHTLAVYPEEAVALITSDGNLHIVDNKSDDPENSFVVDLLDIKRLNPVGMIHSHPYSMITPRKTRIDRRTPSKADMQTYQNFGLEFGFGIVACDGENVSTPLWLDEPINTIGERFIHGYSDCWECIRAWYMENRDIDLGYFPREFAWWETDQPSMYDTHLPDIGFVEIDARDIDIGDVVLFKIGSDQINHAGLYVNNNVMLHHLYSQLSTTEPYSDWMDRAVRVMRLGEVDAND